MSLKSKGIAAERDLVHKLQDNGWAAIRVAASGSTKTPSADIISGKGGRVLVIECKTVKGKSRYVEKKQIEEFAQFGAQFGAECWLAVRFFRKKWKFLLLEDLKQTPGAFAITQEISDQKGLLLEEVLEL